MTGTIVNTAAIFAGGMLGLAIAKLNNAGSDGRIAQGVMHSIALAVIVLGIHMAFAEHEFFPAVVAMAVGTFIGELLRIEDRIEILGDKLKLLIKSDSSTFVKGFVTASILYCVGATAIIGSIKDGLNGDPSLLYVKSLLDGITSVILASTLGIGVVFSALSVFIYQGILTIGSSQLTFLLDPKFMNGISVTGGIMVMGIGLNILGITKLRIGNMLPALILIVLYDYFI